MGWTNIVVEGFCFGEFICGKECPDACCLDKGGCPFFGYASSTERDAAFFTTSATLLL